MEKVKKGQFFMIATIILVAGVISLISAFTPTPSHIPDFSTEESLMKEYEKAVKSNISIDSLVEFAKSHGIKSIVATSGNGITIYNGYGGTARVLARRSDGTEFKAEFQKSHHFSIIDNATIFVDVDGKTISFSIDGSKYGIVSYVFIDNINENGYLKSIYISR